MTKAGIRTRDMVYIALFAVLITVCSWISIPMVVPFTLQTFGIFAALGFLGGKRGTISVAVYILLGLAGAPVFSGFMGGPGVLFGATGGYIVGFIATALAYWLITARFGESIFVMAAAMAVGLILCYALGTAWFMLVYTGGTGPLGLGAALGWCVLPFILPDAAKLGLAIALTKMLKKRISL